MRCQLELGLFLLSFRLLGYNSELLWPLLDCMCYVDNTYFLVVCSSQAIYNGSADGSLSGVISSLPAPAFRWDPRMHTARQRSLLGIRNWGRIASPCITSWFLPPIHMNYHTLSHQQLLFLSFTIIFDLISILGSGSQSARSGNNPLCGD